MFKSLLGSLAQIAAKPQVLLAGIIATVFQAIILYFSLDSLQSVLQNALLLGELPNVGLLELPFQFYKMYFNEMNVLLLLLLASMIVQFWLVIVVARFAENSRHNKGILEAIGFGIKSFWKIIGAIVFLFAVVGIFFALFQIIGWLGELSTELSLALLALLLLFIAYLYVKLVFFLSVMGAKAENARNALMEAWEFSKKKFWKIVLLLAILSIITAAIDFAGSIAADPFGESVLSVIIMAFFSILGTTFAALVLANYYLNHELEHSKLYYEGRRRQRGKKK